MKKILVLAVMFTAIFSTCHADAIRISDINAEEFLGRMRNVLYSEDVQKEFPIAITDLVRGTNDLTEYDLKVWSSFFGKQGLTEPDGEVTFYVDKDNLVYSVKITLRKNDNIGTEFSNIFGSVCKALDLTEEEGLKLFSGGQSEDENLYHAEVERNDKVFLVITVLDNDVTRTLFLAGDRNA